MLQAFFINKLRGKRAKAGKGKPNSITGFADITSKSAKTETDLLTGQTVLPTGKLPPE